MLHEFLKHNQKEILLLSEDKTKDLNGARGVSELLGLGVPLFYDQLIKVLENKFKGRAPPSTGSQDPPADMLVSAAKHGSEYLRLGYSLSHVVHAYGAMCQAITELAARKNARVSADEFNVLNSCLDVAIAAAVSEFHYQSTLASEEQEVKTLGFLAHELRNALSSASVAHEMIKAGLVGTGGSTAKVLEANLARMRHLIDRSLSEVRMRADADLFVEKFKLAELFDQIVITADTEAKKKGQKLTLEIDRLLEIEADRQFVLSAVTNLVQNAIKYSKNDCQIFLRAKHAGDKVSIEVEDECGGIDSTKIATLFAPYVQAGSDRTGMGLGLSITQRAILLSQGSVNVRNINKGCVFTIELPKTLAQPPSNKMSVPGKDSVQPHFRRRT